MSNYYSKRDAKVRLCEELSNRGWKIFGYKENESDSMTDYYSPADWSGLATKNGYILVVDDKQGRNSNSEITVYNNDYKYMNNNDTSKIEALKNMTQDNGATVGEENNAKMLIEKISSKFENQTTSRYQVVDVYPSYMGNSKGSIWHIEKDGALIDKGNSLTVFADVPYSWEFDIAKMEYTETYKECRSYNYETGCEEWTKRNLTETETKAIKSLKAFVLRVERAVNSMNTCGDGTAETEAQGQEQQNNETMEKVIIKTVKTVIKPVKVERTEIQENDILSLQYHGHFWMVTSIYTNAKNQKCIVYECLGSASRGYQRTKNAKRYYQTETQLVKEMENGKVSLFTLQEVEEVTEVEKWVKVKASKTTNKTTSTAPETKTKNTVNETVVNTIVENDIIVDVQEASTTPEVTIILNEAKKGVELHFNNKPSLEVRTAMKQNGFHWAGLKRVSVWYCKQSESVLQFAYKLELQLNKIDIIEVDNNTMTEVEEAELFTNDIIVNETETTYNTSPYNQDKIEIGYIYNCHFKSWDMTIKQLNNELLSLGISENNIIDYGNKIGVNNANYSLMKCIELINNKNGSILFIDSKIKIDIMENKKVPA